MKTSRTLRLGAVLGGLALALALARAPVAAADISPIPTASEQPFVTKASTDLLKQFPKAADAEKAGWMRYTDEDDTGAISYTNGAWTSADADHPSQLWYDVNGNLIGADFSVPLSDTRPVLWGIDPARWGTHHKHVHYALAGPNGTTVFGATGGAKFKAAGGDADAPTAEQLVTAGIAKQASDVQMVFTFPNIWDLEVWLVPNPNGAFADMNPNVKPAHSPKPMKM